MVQADRGDAGIVDFRAFDFSGGRLVGECFKVPRPLAQQPQARAGLPCSKCFERGDERRRRIVNLRVSYNGEEFVKTRPCDRPRSTGISKMGDSVQGFLMPRRVFPVRVNEDVGIDGDHE